VAGSLLAAAVITMLPRTETRTAKLLHDPGSTLTGSQAPADMA